MSKCTITYCDRLAIADTGFCKVCRQRINKQCNAIEAKITETKAKIKQNKKENKEIELEIINSKRKTDKPQNPKIKVSRIFDLQTENVQLREKNILLEAEVKRLLAENAQQRATTGASAYSGPGFNFCGVP